MGWSSRTTRPSRKRSASRAVRIITIPKLPRLLRQGKWRALFRVEVFLAVGNRRISCDTFAGERHQIPNVRSVDLHRLIIASGRQPLAVWAPRHAGNGAIVAAQGQHYLPVAASHTFAVLSPLPVASRAPSRLHATLLNPDIVAAQGQHYLARGRVPHLRRPVRTPSRQPRAVLAPRHAENVVVVAVQSQPYMGSKDGIM